MLLFRLIHVRRTLLMYYYVCAEYLLVPPHL